MQGPQQIINVIVMIVRSNTEGMKKYKRVRWMKGGIVEDPTGMVQRYFNHALGKNKHRKMKRSLIRNVY